MLGSFGITSDDVRKYPWQELIKGAARPEMLCYYSMFVKRIEECHQAGDSLGANVYRLLAGLASLRPTYDSPDGKYQPLFEGAIAPDNYLDGDLDVIEQLLPDVADVEFKSRVADLLWLRRRKKNPDHARIAVDSFLAAASALEDDRFDCMFTDRIKRAVQLSALLGSEKDLFTNTTTHVNGLIQKYSQTGRPWICSDLMNILLEYGEGDAAKLSPVCSDLAVRLQGQNDFNSAQDYWRLQSKWLRLLGDEEAGRLALVNEAEAIVLEADAATKRKIPSFATAKEILARGIEALRRAQGDTNRIDELRQLHAEYAKKSSREMGRIQIPIPDCSQIIQTGINAVAGKSLQEGILSLANLTPTNIKLLRQNLTQSKHPEFLLFGAAYFNEEGKTVGRTEGVSPGATGIEEVHVRAKMFLMARIQWDLMAQTRILPVLAKINSEHNV